MVRGAECATRSALRLDRQSRIDPGRETAKHGLDVCITVMQKKERRTGALMFVSSGAIGDDPLVFREVQSRRIAFDLAQGDIDRPGNML